MRLIEYKVIQSKGGNWFAGCHTIEVMRRNKWFQISAVYLWPMRHSLGQASELALEQ
jgi:hypothetical protein